MNADVAWWGHYKIIVLRPSILGIPGCLANTKVLYGLYAIHGAGALRVFGEGWPLHSMSGLFLGGASCLIYPQWRDPQNVN